VKNALQTARIVVSCLLILCGASARPALALEDGTGPAHIRDGLILGTELLYNRDFRQAEIQFLKMISEAPDHPSGHFYLAMVNWSQLASGFWTREILDLYDKRIGWAIDVAQKAVNRDRNSAEAHFYLGGSLGFKARFYLMQERYFQSFLLALRAVDSLRICRELDPDNRDVLFGLGVFEYYTAKLAGLLRFLSHFLIHPADREAGLEKLHIAADEGIVTRIEAQSTLLHIYLFMEDNPESALPLAERLTREFPENPRFPYLLGSAQLRLGQETEATIALLKERTDKALRPAARIIWEQHEEYLQATTHLVSGRLNEARAVLRSILARVDPQNDPFMAAFPLVKLGMSHDLAGERETALALYAQVLSMENGGGAQFLAKKYQAAAILPDDPFLLY